MRVTYEPSTIVYGSYVKVKDVGRYLTETQYGNPATEVFVQGLASNYVAHVSRKPLGKQL